MRVLTELKNINLRDIELQKNLISNKNKKTGSHVHFILQTLINFIIINYLFKIYKKKKFLTLNLKTQ